MSDTAPAPRVVYHSNVSVMVAQCEPPETATAVPDEEVTVDDEPWRLAFAELDDVVALALCVEEEVPGMVWAATLLKTPTPATAANAIPNVSLLRSSLAAPRRAATDFRFPMVHTLAAEPEGTQRETWEVPENWAARMRRMAHSQ